jgi:hypothetical protein
MLRNITLFLLMIFSFEASSQDSLIIRKIYTAALNEGQAYTFLSELTSRYPGRLSGSKAAAGAVEWAYERMKSLGFDTVYLQECMVPHWVRGNAEEAKVFAANSKTGKKVNICALGGSVATPSKGITADVVEVKSFDELNKAGRSLNGKIVFFNQVMDPTHVSTFDAYGGAVGARWAGAEAASQYGALAVVVRSMTLAHDDLPHTGVMSYGKATQKIPACAISTNDADDLSKQLKAGNPVTMFLKTNCETLPDEKSYNVIGEMRGDSKDVIVMGGHLDSWDNGAGAHDDGAGCVQSIEMLRLFKTLGIKPKHTIRAVLFMNEENGGRGGDKYAEEALRKKEKHIAAIESDAGGFSPRGFSMDAPVAVREKVKSWVPLLFPYGVYDFTREGGGADIEPLKEQGVPLFELSPDSQRYFDFHHTSADQLNAVNPRELALGAAAVASFVYLIDTYGL